jgi:vitamin B12 transporter
LKRAAGAAALTGLMAALPDGQARAQGGSMTLLPALIVSATTIPTPAEQIASSVTVITAEDIERTQRRTLTDVLQLVPGLNIVQQGTPGQLTAIFMRGTNSNHVKLLIDGVDAGDPSTPNGALDLGHLTTADIERVEVLRGPQSGLYGANAIGGVISITTKKGSGPAKVTGFVEGGSFGTFNQAAGVSGGSDRFHYAFNVSHFRFNDMPVTPDYLVPPGGIKNGNAYDNWTYSTRFGVNLSENFAVNFAGRYTDAKLRFTEDVWGTPNNERSTYDNNSFVGRGEAVWTLWDGRFVNVFGVNYTDVSRANFNPVAGTRDKYDGARDKYDWRGTLALAPGHNLVMGLERENERATANLYSASTGNQAGYVELQSDFGKRFFIVANARYDDHDDFGEHGTWRVAPAFIVPGTETKLKASYGTGFKAPTLYELYGKGDFGSGYTFIGNPLLKPEESRGYDVGFEQPLFGGRVQFGATYFHNDITNLINFASTGDPFVSTYVNIDNAETKGVEAFASVVFSEQFRVRADYTYVRAINADTGAFLLRRPKDKWSVAAIWNPMQNLTVSTTVVHVGGWMDFDRGGMLWEPAYVPGYTVVNLAMNYVLNNNATVFARVDNLFDRKYENPYGWEQPRLGAYAGLRLTTN